MDPKQIQDILLENEVIGDVIDGFIPKVELKVKYRSAVELGTKMTPAETAAVPTVSWAVDANALYTLACVVFSWRRMVLFRTIFRRFRPSDPDAPSRSNPKFRNWRHWIVGNIKGSDLSSGIEVSGYKGPSPPKGTGFHRYVFVLYQQAGVLPYEAVPDDNPMDRASFNLREWAKGQNAGQIVACNFFQAQH